MRSIVSTANGGRPVFGTRTMRLADLHLRRPRHHALQLVQELRLARLLRRQVQAQAELVYGGAAGGGHDFTA